MKYNFDKVCRICGNYDSQFIPIFDGDGLVHNLPGKVRKHLTPLNVKQNDQLPQQICYQCVSSLVLWSDLFELSVKINKNYRNELKKSEKNNTTASASIIENPFIHVSLEDASENEDILNNVETSNNNTTPRKVTSLLDDDTTAKIFDEINDFESFLNNSPASSHSTDTDVELLGNDVEVLGNEVEVLGNESVVDNEIDLIVEENTLEPHNSLPPDEISPSTSAQINDNPTETNDDSTAKPKRRKRVKNALRSRVCHICGKTFKGPDTMRLHVKTVHSEDRPHICAHCGTAFKRRDHLVCHIKYKHENISYPKRQPSTTVSQRTKRLCGHCGKILSSSHLLKEHINSFHSDQQPYRCEKCNLSFSRYANLYHHAVTRNHKISSFSKTCDVCGLDFQSETFYMRHRWKHPEVDFCEECQLQFNSNAEFRQHVETVHEEEKPLQCDTCGKKFRTKNSLKLHVRVHTGEKPYQCQYCSWRFPKKGQLVVHIYRHTGERPYVCSICDRGFKQRGDMRKHKAGHLKQIKTDSTC